MLILLLLLLVGINLLQLAFASPGSDHFVHFGVINSIRATKNHFITKVITYINEDDFPDPQLYHWLLSFIPAEFLDRHYKYMGLVFNVLSFLFFVVFLNLLYPYLSVALDKEVFIFYAGLIYVLTPFEYFAWNAKNVGLSARGFGLMFGHLFVYLFTLYLFSSNTYFFVLTILTSYIILLSSQFAFQFVLFFSLIASIIIGNPSTALIPFIAIVLFFITFRRWSRVFFQRQWEYKKTYYNVLSERFGLKERYSIWRDFIKDFWTVVKQKGVLRGFEYIYRNPIIELILGFPSLVVLILFFLTEDQSELTSQSAEILLSIIGSAFLIFFLTSFRKTRFLGEPQRYIEFIFPLISTLAAMAYTPFLLIPILVPSILLILFDVIGIKQLAKQQGGGTTTHEKTMDLLHSFNHLETSTKNRVASNNTDVLKYFAQKDFRILNINVTSEYTGGIHFNEIFPEKYGNVALQPLIQLSKLFKIDWLILDNKLISKADFVREFGSDFEEIKTIHHYTIFRMC